MADHLAVLNMPVEALKRSHTVTSFDPLTLLPALAMVTETSRPRSPPPRPPSSRPIMIARRFASLDHISGGRAGWNIVTTSNPDAALNFGLEEHMEHDERYARAREFYDVVTGLWDSFADDAFVARRRERRLFRSRKAACAQPQGALSLGARPAQHRAARAGLAGHRAGGRVRCRPPACRRDRRGRVRRGRTARRRPGLLRRRQERAPRRPGAIPIISKSCPAPSSSSATATTKRAKSGRRSTASCITRARSPRSRSRWAPTLRDFDPDGPLPEIPESNASQQRARPRGRARRSARNSPCASSRSGSAAIPASPSSGRPKTVADRMEQWFVERGSDGFNVMFPFLPAGLDDFVDKVVPELQRRGLFRKEYEGPTLRDNLGLPRPENRFFD